jgi:O-antigen/teichoic acid export membrane protein
MNKTKITKNEIKKLVRSKIIQNFFIYSSGAFFISAINFFLIPIYTRVFTPYEYGQLALLITFIGILSTILGLGLAPTVTIFYYKVDKERRVETITNIIFTYIILSLPFIILMLFGTNNINKYIFEGQISGNLIILSVLIVFFSFFPIVYFNVLKMEEKALKRTILQVANGSLIVALNIYLIYFLRVGIIGILLTNLSSLLIILLIGSGEYFYKFKKIKVNLNLKETKDFLRVGLPMVPGGLAFWALTFSDRWILMKYISYSDVGIYSLAYSFGIVWDGLILASFGAAYTPRLYRAYKDNLIETEKKNMRVLRYYLIFSLIGVIAIVSGLYFIFPFLIGENFQVAYKFIWIVLLGYVFYGAFALTNHFPYILKKTYYATFCVIIATGMNIGLNFIFIPRYGIAAAAYTTMISFLIMFIIGYMLRTRLYKRTCIEKRNS